MADQPESPPPPPSDTVTYNVHLKRPAVVRQGRRRG